MPVLVGVWEEGALGPEKDRELSEELALERDLFRATDAGLSRWENAPKLSPDGEAGAELFVPVRAGLTPLVIEDCSFGRVQEDVPPAAQSWKVAPAQLSEPGAAGTWRVGLARLRAADSLGPRRRDPSLVATARASSASRRAGEDHGSGVDHQEGPTR